MQAVGLENGEGSLQGEFGVGSRNGKRAGVGRECTEANNFAGQPSRKHVKVKTMLYWHTKLAFGQLKQIHCNKLGKIYSVHIPPWQPTGSAH